jgi:hypothetical protein
MNLNHLYSTSLCVFLSLIYKQTAEESALMS